MTAELREPGEPTGGGGAPTDATYLVTTANGSLSAEVVVGATPGGELGGTWAAPTVDATHSGSTHAAAQAAAEATAAAALAAHEADTTAIHGIANTGALETTSGAQTKVDTHVNDTSDAHDASAISIADAGSDFTATDVEGALDELQADHETDVAALAAHLADGTDAHAAAAVTNTPAGSIAATTVQGALNELDTEKAATASAVMDGDTAGGVLAGTFPSPGFAADMATQAELDAHTGDTSDAHDASAISILDTATDFTATDVEGALAELQTADEADEAALTAHVGDTSAAHAASAVSADSTTLVGVGTDVQAVLEELDNGIADHLADAADAHAASAITNTPAGSVAATTVQAAINELDAEKQPLDTELTALGGLTSAADKGIQFTGAGTAGTYDLTAAGKALLDDATAAAQRVTLDVPSNAEAVLDTLADAKGDLFVASAADTIARLAVGSNDQVLTADSAQSTGVKWAAAAGGSLPTFTRVSGNWYDLAAFLAMEDRLTTGQDTTAGRIWLMYHPYADANLEGLGVEVTTGGDAGAKLRLGVYAVAGGGGIVSSYDNAVGSNLYDSGQIAADTTGYKTGTGLSIPIPPEGLWLTFVGQSFATAPTIRCIDYNSAAYGPAANASQSDRRGGAIATGGATGALPATLTGLVNGVGGLGWILPHFAMRYS